MPVMPCHHYVRPPENKKFSDLYYHVFFPEVPQCRYCSNQVAVKSSFFRISNKIRPTTAVKSYSLHLIPMWHTNSLAVNLRLNRGPTIL